MEIKSPKLLLFTALWVLALAASSAWAEKIYGPGATDTEIKVGQTMPYSGPGSSYGTIGKTELANKGGPKTLRDEINVQEFETGFPVDFGQIRQELGPDVLIHGGPNIMLLLNGTPSAIRDETRRILNSGIAEGRRFILREGNNLAPHTPLINLDAMYQEARQFSWSV